MAKITFIILAHENAAHLADMARLLIAWSEDAHAVIHYDLNSPAAQFEKLKQACAGSDRIHFVENRIRCGWGDFSLVESVLRALRVIRDDKIACDRVMLVSGACMPIRPLAELSDYLDANPHREFIEVYNSDWIVGGLREERYLYHHPVNHRKYYNTFRYIFQFQKALKLKRKLPAGILPKFGSQWWVLTWDLCANILGFLDRNPDIYRFFRTTWIPDEMMFQTLAFHLVASENLAGHNLTFYQFNDWGMPQVFSNWHLPLLKTIPRFFARKIGGGASELKKQLHEIALSPHDKSEPLPDIPVRWRMPDRQIAADNARLKQGYSRLFAHNGTQTMFESLLEDDRDFAVFYGPPEITYRTIEHIRHLAGYSMLGRVFHPSWIDHGHGEGDFQGLGKYDNLVRDEYPANYLRRLFLRCEGIPVFTMSPGDNPELELQLFQTRKAAIFSLVPRPGGQIALDLYWLLCARGVPERPTDDPRFVASHQNRPDSTVVTDERVKEALNEAVLRRDQPISQSALEAHFEYEHGELAEPLMRLFQIATATVMAQDFQRTLETLPEAWRQRFKPLDTGQPLWRLVPGMKIENAEIVIAGPLQEAGLPHE